MAEVLHITNPAQLVKTWGNDVGYGPNAPLTVYIDNDLDFNDENCYYINNTQLNFYIKVSSPYYASYYYYTSVFIDGQGKTLSNIYQPGTIFMSFVPHGEDGYTGVNLTVQNITFESFSTNNCFFYTNQLFASNNRLNSSTMRFQNCIFNIKAIEFDKLFDMGNGGPGTIYFINCIFNIEIANTSKSVMTLIRARGNLFCESCEFRLNIINGVENTLTINLLDVGTSNSSAYAKATLNNAIVFVNKVYTKTVVINPIYSECTAELSDFVDNNLKQINNFFIASFGQVDSNNKIKLDSNSASTDWYVKKMSIYMDSDKIELTSNFQSLISDHPTGAYIINQLTTSQCKNLIDLESAGYIVANSSNAGA